MPSTTLVPDSQAIINGRLPPDDIDSEEEEWQEEQRRLENEDDTGVNTRAYTEDPNPATPTARPYDLSSMIVENEKDTSIVNLIANFWQGCLDDGVLCTAQYLTQTEQRVNNSIKNIQPEHIEQAFTTILLSISDSVLRHITYGSLAYAYRTDGLVRRELDQNFEFAKDQLSIYRQELVSLETGLPPTPHEWMEVILHYFEVYRPMDGDIDVVKAQKIVDIDTFIAQPASHATATTILAQEGHRRYFAKKGVYGDEQGRSTAQTCDDFFNQVFKRIGQIDDSEYDKAMRMPMSNTGYGLRAIRRLHDHKLHRNSNYVMNLTEALFGVLFPGRFYIDRRVIFNIWSTPQASLAEIVFARISQGYTHDGGGFSHWTAGSNNGDPASLQGCRWDVYKQRAHDHTPFLERAFDEGFLEEIPAPNMPISQPNHPDLFDNDDDSDREATVGARGDQEEVEVTRPDRLRTELERIMSEHGPGDDDTEQEVLEHLTYAVNQSRMVLDELKSRLEILDVLREDTLESLSGKITTKQIDRLYTLLKERVDYDDYEPEFTSELQPMIEYAHLLDRKDFNDAHYQLLRRVRELSSGQDSVVDEEVIRKYRDVEGYRTRITHRTMNEVLWDGEIE